MKIIAKCFSCGDIKEVSLIGGSQHCERCKPADRVKKKTELKRSPIKKISKKEAKNISNKKKAYKVREETRDKVCTGCGSTQNLSHSHLVPVGQNKSLESMPSNITYHCLSIGDKIGCHDIWEHDREGRKYLKDYKRNLDIIKKIDYDYYLLIIGKE